VHRSIGGRGICGGNKKNGELGRKTEVQMRIEKDKGR
jgi:hypothetical protein